MAGTFCSAAYITARFDYWNYPRLVPFHYLRLA